MTCRSMVEVFDIVKRYHYLHNKYGGHKFMCLAAKDAFRYGQISEKEMYSLIDLITDEMQYYADLCIPEGNRFKVYDSTTLYSVMIETLKYSEQYSTLCGRDNGVLFKKAEEIIPLWWDAFYEKLRAMEVE